MVPGVDVNSTFKNLSITLASNPGPNNLVNTFCAAGFGLKQSKVPSFPLGHSLVYFVPNQKAELLVPAVRMSVRHCWRLARLFVSEQLVAAVGKSYLEISCLLDKKRPWGMEIHESKNVQLEWYRYLNQLTD